jgi:hypothetical protein
VTNYDDRDVERLLRRALTDAATRLEPAGDGLTKIRERVHGRRRWMRWAKPTLALAGAAALLAGLVAAPAYLLGRGGRPTLVGPAGQPAQLSEPAAGTAASPAPPGAWGTPIAGDRSLPDRLAVWPYPSRRTGYQRADADVASGRYPDLVDPGRTAIDFIASYVGSTQGLTAVPLGPAGPGLQVLVQRSQPAQKPLPVSNVYLVRVRQADDSPYVVLGASRSKVDGPADSLTIAPPPRLSGTAAFTVTGTVRRPAGTAAPTVRVALREPGSAEDLGLGSATTTAGGPAGTWSVELSPFRRLASSGAVAAWTVDGDGLVVEFVAAPIPQ